MNINYFFLAVSVSLMLIFFLFQPVVIQQKIVAEVPLFTIFSFSMHELDSKGLITLMNGTKAVKYTNRYTVDNMNYTDNSKKYIANMKSNKGIYKDDIVYLFGDIIYAREDGLNFETQEAVYDKKTSIAIARGDYVLYQGSNRVVGSDLQYNNLLQQTESKNVKAIYQLKESKR